MIPIPTPSLDETKFLLNGKNAFGREFICVMAFQEGLAAVTDQSGWYHINLQGEPCYAERYERAFGYYFKRSAVVKTGQWFHITDRFLPAYPSFYLWCGNYMEEVCTVKDKEHYYHIDLNGKSIYKEKYKYAGDFYEGIAAVQLEDGSFRHIKKDGSFLHNFSAQFLGIYHKGYAIAKDQFGWFSIDKYGKEVFRERYMYLEPFYNGRAFAIDFSGKSLFLCPPK